MDLVFEKKEEISVDVYGSNYKVRKPTISEVEEYQAKSEKAGEAGQLRVTRMFLDTLGMPEKVSKELQMDNFLTLVEALVSPKKKE